jgi:ComF family protein
MFKINHLIQSIINIFYPVICPYCRTKVDQEFSTCNSCWPKVQRIEKPFCLQCAAPLEAAFLNEEKCGACILTPPAFDQALAVYAYSDLVKKIALKLKRSQATPTARFMAHHMHQVGKSFLQESDFIIPVPLHPNRLKQRGFNQATLLAKALAPSLKVKINTSLLKRHRDTPSQGQLSRKSRQKNIEKAFSIHSKTTEKTLLKSTITLIDDVMTTGATLEACAKTLKKAGAEKVNVLVFSRSIR